jgi:hypothetical protein
MTRTDLPDGTYLDVTGDDLSRGVDSETGLTATWDAAGSRLVDSAGKVIREVAKRRHRANAGPRKASGGKATPDGSRFATLNAFVDEAMRHLSPVASAVWMKLFRDCRDGRVTASNRDLASCTGCSLRAVTTAVQRLREAGLIHATRLSRHRGEPSHYTLNPRPDRCVDALTEMNTARTGAKDAPVDSTP